MSYMQEVDKRLEDILSDVPAAKRPEVKSDIKDALLHSYRNGQSAPKTGDSAPKRHWRPTGSHSLLKAPGRPRFRQKRRFPKQNPQRSKFDRVRECPTLKPMPQQKRKEKPMTLDRLARMVKLGFDETRGNFARVETRFENLAGGALQLI